jgi:asparagine synthase (glutamine-hydrolysing)
MLTKVDRGSMAHGLEVRVPFLDHRVVELASALPSDLKLHRGRWFAVGPPKVQSKWALHQAFAHQVPRVIRRRRKAGFDAPISGWLRGPLRPLVHDALEPSRLEREGLLEPKVVTDLLDAHASGRADHAWRIWGLVVLCDWARRHQVL